MVIKIKQNIKALELSDITDGHTKWNSHFKSSLAISHKGKKICLPYHPEIPLLSIGSCKIKIYVHRRTLT